MSILSRAIPTSWRTRIVLVFILFAAVAAMSFTGVYATTLNVSNVGVATKTWVSAQQNTSTCARSVVSTVPVLQNDKITGVTVTFSNSNTCVTANATVTIVDGNSNVDSGSAALAVGNKTVTVPIKGKPKQKTSYTYKVSIN